MLAEDTPVLQKVATIMLEKLGAKVVAVGDGLQTVNALHQEGGNKSREPPYDLILMDCQVSMKNLFIGQITHIDAFCLSDLIFFI